MLIGLPDFAKERKLSKIENYQIVDVPYLFMSKGDILHFFYKFDKFEIYF